MDWIIWLSVSVAVLYMGRRVWRVLRGKGEISCGGCGKPCGCAGSCPSQQGEAGACGLRDRRP